MNINKKLAKLAGITISASLLFPVMGVYAEESTKSDLGFVQCQEYVNIRSEASTDGEIVGKIYHNGKLDILDKTEDGWYKVHSGNVDGYIKSDYVVTGEEAQSIAATAGYTTALVGAYSLNIRSSMSSEAEVVGAAEEGNKLEVVQDNGDWVKVVTNDGVYGFVSADYVYTSTEYRLAETLEEEQARLDAQWLSYLASSQPEEAKATAEQAQQAASDAQAAADAQYQAYLEAQAAADAAPSDTSYTEDTYSEDTYSEDTYTESTNTYEDTASSDAQAAADAQYQAYLDAQAIADNAVSAADAAASAADAVAAYAEENTYTEDTSSSDSDASYTENTSSNTEEAYSDNTYTEETTSAPAASSTGQAIADYACQFVGNPYVYGGSSLTSGTDCSGFVMAVFANFGISLPHYSGSQMGYGSSVDASSLAPGDLVFYGAGGSQHVAIYIGGGSIVHAANSSVGITITGINWPGTPSGYRRLV